MNNLTTFLYKSLVKFFVMCLLAGAALTLSVCPLDAKDKEASIKDIIVNNSSNDLLLYLTVINAFTGDMEKGIQNGISATFTFYVNLYEIKKGWLDEDIESQTFTRTLTYNNLKEEYSVVYSELDNKVVTVKDLEEAKTMMSELNGFPVTTLDNLTPGGNYIIKVKASLAKKTLPLYFHYLIPFWRLWDFETDWHFVEFRY